MADNNGGKPPKYVVIVWIDGMWQIGLAINNYIEAKRAQEQSLSPAVFVSTVGKYGAPCDTAVGHGPGHQSISECAVLGEHTEHHAVNGNYEWTDKDLTTQTYTRRSDGRVFRLTFADWAY